MATICSELQLALLTDFLESCWPEDLGELAGYARKLLALKRVSYVTTVPDDALPAQFTALGWPEGMPEDYDIALIFRTNDIWVTTNNGASWSALYQYTGYPTGTIVPYAGGTTPAGWLKCDGSAVSRTTYANLYAKFGTAYGGGDESTTFNLPDLRGRAPFGLDGMGLDYYFTNTQTKRRKPRRLYRLNDSALGLMLNEGLDGAAGNGSFAGNPILQVNGTITNTSNRGVRFDGSGDWGIMPNYNFQNQSASFVIWFRAFSPMPAQQALLGIHETSTLRKSFSIQLLSTGAIRVSYFNDTITTAAGLVVANQNNQVIVTFDFPTTTTRIYVNGVLALSAVCGPYQGSAVASTCLIGSDTVGTNNFFGLIDDTSIYDYVLTDAESAEDYESGRRISNWTGFTNAYRIANRIYRMQETVGTTAANVGLDASADGTYVGGPTLGQPGIPPGEIPFSQFCPSFDGVDDQVTLPVMDLSAKDFSIGMWLFASSLSGTRTVFSYNIGAGVGGRLLINILSDGTITVDLNGSSVSTPAGTFKTGLPNFVLYTYKHSTTTGRIYHDGVLAATNTSIATVTGVAVSMRLANHAGTQWWAGKIDEVLIDTIEYSASYAAILMAAGYQWPPGNPNRLVATSGRVLGGTAGLQTHTLALTELPAHAHSTYSFVQTGAAGVARNTYIGSTNSTSQGGGLPHNNMSPYLVLNYIVKA